MLLDTKGYFAILGLTPSCSVDKAALRRRYVQAQQQHHPDRNSTTFGAAQQTAQVNDAWRVLSDPLLRARYLLTGSEKHTEQTVSDPDVLMDAMQQREALENAATAGDCKTLLEANQQQQQQYEQQATSALTQQDNALATDILLRWNYARKAEQSIRDKQRTLLLQSHI